MRSADGCGAWPNVPSPRAMGAGRRARQGGDPARGRRSASIFPLLGSALLHGALVIVASRAEAPRDPSGPGPLTSEVEFTVSGPLGDEPHADLARAETRPATAPPAPRLAVVRHPHASLAPTTEGGWDFPVPAEPDSGACIPPDAGTPAIRWAAIDPAAAAASVITRDPRQTRDAGTGPGAGALSAAMSEDLRETAMAQPYLTERGPPRLHRRTDGTYRYESSQFDAVIGSDGSVTFSDRSIDMPAPGVLTFDINDAIMRSRGQDPYQHERQWFLDSTEPSRDRLAQAAMHREADRALRDLPARLARIWADDRATARDRRLRLFDVWDDCADDDIGRRAREIVERFVRTELPRGSADAFTGAELAALNARRASPVPFAPYG